MRGRISATSHRCGCSKSSPTTAAICAAATGAARSTRSPRTWACNVIAFGHTADDFCEALLRNTMFTGKAEFAAAGDLLAQPRLPADPPAGLRHRGHHDGVRRASMGIPVIPCGCSQRTGTVRRALRDMFGGTGTEHPHLKETMLSAMGNVDTGRLLDTRFLNLDDESGEPETQARNCFRLSRNCNRPSIDPRRAIRLPWFSPYQAQLMRLLPREEKFYHLFLKQVEIISEASRLTAGRPAGRQCAPGGRRHRNQRAGAPRR